MEFFSVQFLSELSCSNCVACLDDVANMFPLEVYPSDDVKVELLHYLSQRQKHPKPKDFGLIKNVQEHPLRRKNFARLSPSSCDDVD
jgi:hypothetical protein